MSYENAPLFALERVGFIRSRLRLSTRRPGAAVRRAMLIVAFLASTAVLPANATDFTVATFEAYNDAVSRAVDGDRIILQNSIALGTAPNVINHSITILGGGNALTGSGSFQALIANAGTLGVQSLTLSNVAAAGSSSLTLGGNNASTSFDGTIQETSTLGVVKSGAGTVLFSGTNTYSGGTSLVGGVLGIGASGAIGTGTLTFGGGSLKATASGVTLASALVLNNAAVVDTNGATLTLAGTISGASSLTKAGTGTLVLTGSNSYSGGTLISGGILQVGQGGTTGSLQGDSVNSASLVFNRSDSVTYSGAILGSGSLTQAGLGTLILTGANGYRGGTTVASGTLQIGDGGTSGSLSGSTVNNSVLAFNRADALTYGGAISGTGQLIQAGSGSLTLTGSNRYSGGTLAAGGTLAVGRSNALGTGALTLDGGILQAAAAGLTLSNAIALNAAGTIDTQAFGLTLSGGITGSGALTKTGSATLSLTGSNSFSGGLQINAGTLAIGNAAGLGTGTVTLAGGTLQAGRDSLTLANKLLVSANGSGGSNSIDTQGFNLTVAGPIGGSGGLTKVGTGLVTLNGSNGFTGGLQINAGTVGIGNEAALGSGTVTLNGGALMASANGLTVANGLQLTAASSTGGIINTQDFNLTLSGSIGGTGTLTKTGNGVLTLTGNNSFSGGVQLNAGTLAAGSARALGSGTWSFKGGTFQASADGLALSNSVVLQAASASSGSVVGGGTIDTQNFGLTVSGPISGSGSLTKTGSGKLTLSSKNAYFGTTTLQAGTLALGATGALGTGPLVMDDGTTLAFAADGIRVSNRIQLSGIADPVIDTGAHSAAITGSISGDASLTKIGSGTLRLLGTNSFTGGVTISAGTLQGSVMSLGSGPIQVDAALVVQQTIDGTLSNPISGSGSFTKTGAGVLDLGSVNSFSGPTSVAGGTLNVSGSLANSTITLNNGASLSGSGSIGGLVAGAGSVVTGGSTTPYGTLNVNGDATFASGSTFKVNVTAAGQNTALAVGGKATVKGGAVKVVAASGAYSASTTYNILTAKAGVSGNFGSLTASSNLAFLSPVLSYGSDSVTLGFKPKDVPLTTVAVTPNQVAVAQSLDGLGTGSKLSQSVQGLSATDARTAFSSLSGTTQTTTAPNVVQNTKLINTAVLDRLYTVAGSGLDARKLLDQLSPNGVPTFVQCFAPLERAAPTPLTNATVWGEGFGGVGHSDGSANVAASDRTSTGFVLGADTPLHGFSLPVRVGVAGGYTASQISQKQDGGSNSTESVFGSFYGSTRYGSIDVRGGVSFSSNSNHVARVVAFPGFNESERSTSGGRTFQSFAELGYRFTWPRLLLEPVIDGGITYTQQDGYHEIGGVAALKGFAQDSVVETTTIGLRAEGAPFDGLPLVARQFLGWRHSFGDINPASVLAFVSGSAPFTSTGATVDRNALMVETGLDWRPTTAVTIGLTYSGQIAAHDTDHSGKGRVEYKF